MTKYVVGPQVAIRLAREGAVIADGLELLAPTLIRSQVLSSLYQAVGRGDMTKRDAARHLDYIRGLKIRFLGDRTLQRVAWEVAEQLGWPDTLEAEYVALTKLQAEALVTLDQEMAEAVQGVVETVAFAVLTEAGTSDFNSS